MEQRYNGLGKKSDASTNKTRTNTVKQIYKAKSRLDEKRRKKYNSRTNWNIRQVPKQKEKKAIKIIK
jgi:hypothetical protein